MRVMGDLIVEEVLCKNEKVIEDDVQIIFEGDDIVKAEPETALLDKERNCVVAEQADESDFHINNFTDVKEASNLESYDEQCKALAEKQKQDAERAAEKVKRGSRGFALGSVSDKIVPWLRARFEKREGGKTAIQEVIKLYAYDFPRDSVYFPLESFQVGQLVRQAFPNIELCKVTNSERKRLRCYKNLYRKDVTHGPSPIFPLNEVRPNRRARNVKSTASMKGVISERPVRPKYQTGVAATNEPSLSPQKSAPSTTAENEDAKKYVKTYRSAKLDESLALIKAKRVPPETNCLKRIMPQGGNASKVLLISQPLTVKVPKSNKKVVYVPDNSGTAAKQPIPKIVQSNSSSSCTIPTSSNQVLTNQIDSQISSDQEKPKTNHFMNTSASSSQMTVAHVSAMTNSPASLPGPEVPGSSSPLVSVSTQISLIKQKAVPKNDLPIVKLEDDCSNDPVKNLTKVDFAKVHVLQVLDIVRNLALDRRELKEVVEFVYDRLAELGQIVDRDKLSTEIAK